MEQFPRNSWSLSRIHENRFPLGFWRNHWWNFVATKGKKQIFFLAFWAFRKSNECSPGLIGALNSPQHKDNIPQLQRKQVFVPSAGSELEFCSLAPVCEEERSLFEFGSGRFSGTGILQESCQLHFPPGAVRRTKALGYNLDFVYLCERLQVLLFAPDKCGKF